MVTRTLKAAKGREALSRQAECHMASYAETLRLLQKARIRVRDSGEQSRTEVFEVAINGAVISIVLMRSKIGSLNTKLDALTGRIPDSFLRRLARIWRGLCAVRSL
jgi:hypothetical protein